ncbi:uncharacterized protein LOC130505243 [Raphanus sativus]|uniref:Uncharacterized protein LOC130505243 n=1 Tax=Raphanus sativus TaxID=3726 RepID=A0A9W3CWN3_RAPSA|nr:uncharacterized protein LOC130505243 [Raphanus sativus]
MLLLDDGIGDVRRILVKQPSISHDDSFTWAYNKSGNLTVKSAYWLAREQKIKETFPQALALSSVNHVKEKVWRTLTSPKIKTFLWKALSEALPVADLIIQRGMRIDGRCQLCGLEGETIIHVLFHCDPARQVWVLSGVPCSEIGFENGSLFGNLNYLLNVKCSSEGGIQPLRSWPWVIWNIWKCRNDFIFKGRRWAPEEIVEKAFGEADEWFLAQEVEEELTKLNDKVVEITKKKWTPPPNDWLMSNIGFEWIKHSKLMGGAWVVRNHRGVVLMHSRRAFSNIQSLDEARLVSILWAVESMTSLRYNRVIFAGDFKEIFLALKNPLQWPALRYHVTEVNMNLRLMPEFQVKTVVKEENKGATIIAQTVTREGRLPSYVAKGHPSWLFEFFVNESRLL